MNILTYILLAKIHRGKQIVKKWERTRKQQTRKYAEKWRKVMHEELKAGNASHFGFKSFCIKY